MRDFPLVASADDYARSAEFHVASLKEGAEEHVWSCVHGEDARKERELRRNNRIVAMEASVRSEEALAARSEQEPVLASAAKPRPRRSESIPDRIRKARAQKRRRRVVDPQTVYERLEREGLA